MKAFSLIRDIFIVRNRHTIRPAKLLIFKLRLTNQLDKLVIGDMKKSPSKKPKKEKKKVAGADKDYERVLSVIDKLSHALFYLSREVQKLRHLSTIENSELFRRLKGEFDQMVGCFLDDKAAKKDLEERLQC